MNKEQKFRKQLSIFDLNALFPDDASAITFVEQWRWEYGKPICTKCGSNRSYPRPKTKGHRCSMCRKNFTVRIGTIFEDSRLPLRKWVIAMCLMQQNRLGISARGLEALLGMTQTTSWYVLHRLRDIRDIQAERLNGVVEINETNIGGKEKNKHVNKRTPGRQGGAGKAVVIGARANCKVDTIDRMSVLIRASLGRQLTYNELTQKAT